MTMRKHNATFEEEVAFRLHETPDSASQNLTSGELQLVPSTDARRGRFSRNQDLFDFSKAKRRRAITSFGTPSTLVIA